MSDRRFWEHNSHPGLVLIAGVMYDLSRTDGMIHCPVPACSGMFKRRSTFKTHIEHPPVPQSISSGLLNPVQLQVALPEGPFQLPDNAAPTAISEDTSTTICAVLDTYLQENLVPLLHDTITQDVLPSILHALQSSSTVTVPQSPIPACAMEPAIVQSEGDPALNNSQHSIRFLTQPSSSPFGPAVSQTTEMPSSSPLCLALSPSTSLHLALSSSSSPAIPATPICQKRSLIQESSSQLNGRDGPIQSPKCIRLVTSYLDATPSSLPLPEPSSLTRSVRVTAGLHNRLDSTLHLDRYMRRLQDCCPVHFGIDCQIHAKHDVWSLASDPLDKMYHIFRRSFIFEAVYSIWKSGKADRLAGTLGRPIGWVSFEEFVSWVNPEDKDQGRISEDRAAMASQQCSEEDLTTVSSPQMPLPALTKCGRALLKLLTFERAYASDLALRDVYTMLAPVLNPTFSTVSTSNISVPGFYQRTFQFNLPTLTQTGLLMKPHVIQPTCSIFLGTAIEGGGKCGLPQVPIFAPPYTTHFIVCPCTTRLPQLAPQFSQLLKESKELVVAHARAWDLLSLHIKIDWHPQGVHCECLCLAHTFSPGFDNRLINYFAPEFKPKHQKAPKNYVEIESFEGIDFYTSLTHTHFEELCADLLHSTVEPVMKACWYFNWLKSHTILDRNSNYHIFKSNHCGRIRATPTVASGF
ncbi:hypothetical protein BDR03DRAFT_987039 [Suillus americanus]|nr:hypothetical protein BDR03DRAFT_987039 [Suillus americanus]